MQIKAQLNRLRIAPRKVRLVSGLIKGLDVISAKHQLDFTVKRSARPLVKLLDSAVANAKNNFNLEETNLFVKDVTVNEGTKLKRFRPKGFGRTSPIEKKTSHIKIVLEEKVPGLKAKKAKKQVPEKIQETNISEKTTQAKTFELKKPEIKREIGRKGFLGDIKNISRKFFRRKSI